MPLAGRGVSTVPISETVSRFFCAICGKFVKIDSYCTDSEGRAVHRECLVAEGRTKKAPSRVSARTTQGSFQHDR